MPNIKSAIKRVEITQKKNLENRKVKSELNTLLKKLKVAIANKEVANAEVLYKNFVSALDSARTDGVVHQNSVNRKKAHYAKLVNDMKNA